MKDRTESEPNEIGKINISLGGSTKLLIIQIIEKSSIEQYIVQRIQSMLWEQIRTTEPALAVNVAKQWPTSYYFIHLRVCIYIRIKCYFHRLPQLKTLGIAYLFHKYFCQMFMDRHRLGYAACLITQRNRRYIYMHTSIEFIEDTYKKE